MATRQPVDLLIRHARLLDGRIVDLAIAAGVFVRIGADLSVAARQELDASGQLTTPPLADCHMHLDSVLTLGQPQFNESGTLLEAIQIWSERKPSLTKDDVKRRALSGASGKSTVASESLLSRHCLKHQLVGIATDLPMHHLEVFRNTLGALDAQTSNERNRHMGSRHRG